MISLLGLLGLLSLALFLLLVLELDLNGLGSSLHLWIRVQELFTDFLSSFLTSVIRLIRLLVSLLLAVLPLSLDGLSSEVHLFIWI